MVAMSWERVFSLIANCWFEQQDPLGFVLDLASKPVDEREAVIHHLAEQGLFWVPGEIDWSGFVPNDEGRSLASLPVDELEELLGAAIDVADGRHLGQMPHPSRKEFLDALETAVEAGADLDGISHALFLVRPESFLPLVGQVREFVQSYDGLGIDDEDMPETARDYLDLVMFLTVEMEEGGLPYHDFLEMAHAVGEGRTLREGLVAADRERMVRGRIEPALRRLFPRDDERLAAEVARLLEG